MSIHYLDIPYHLSNPDEISFTRFYSIWKVEVNERYKAFIPKGLKDPGIFITCKGGGLLHDLGDPNITYKLKENSFFLIDRNVPCQYECPPNSEWKFFFLHFSDLLMFEKLRIPISTVYPTGTIDYIARQCEKLIQCLIHNKTGYMYSANQLFQDIILTFAREKAELENHKSSDISRVIYWMHQNIDKPIDVDSLIKMSNLSRGLFFRLFKQVTDMTPAAYFQKLKLESGRLSIQTTDQSIKNIALSLQFCDEFHFTKLFKKEYGLPPSTYRSI